VGQLHGERVLAGCGPKNLQVRDRLMNGGGGGAGGPQGGELKVMQCRGNPSRPRHSSIYIDGFEDVLSADVLLSTCSNIQLVATLGQLVDPERIMELLGDLGNP
jgi:hypothetical protein